MIKQFPASISHLHDMLDFVCQNALEAGFFETDVYQIELAVEEALVNIIKYAYCNKKGVIRIECISEDFDSFKIILVDKGTPYNPLNQSKIFDFSAVLENMSVGGYGIFFILKIMDEIQYKHLHGNNILVLIKHKNP
ncbi:MAG: hypothetical protein BGO14_05425 [Chlamydiales bacterium 38-26]|nr:ATP-binding protein [Chlamydiales bacterium]OJV07914.1 MAG: hypothetical protein BGO14_05425 [Chlamydiales bacterium 38-26]